MTKFAGGDAYRGNTRKHPEHDGKDRYGRKYYAGDGMGGQVAAGFKKKKDALAAIREQNKFHFLMTVKTVRDV